MSQETAHHHVGEGTLFQPIIAGIVASITGFASSFTLVLAGLGAVGATAEQGSSALFVLSLVGGVLCIIVPLITKLPISFNWSTPGAAALVAAVTPQGGFEAAVGAFIVAGALTMLAGIWKPFERAIMSIPKPIASGMLAGILLPIALTPARVAVDYPWVILSMVIVWLVLLRFAPRWAVPAAMAVAVGSIFVMAGPNAFVGVNLMPTFVFVSPTFDVAAIVGIGIPLFIVTMAGQNIPGFAVLNLYGFPRKVRPVLLLSGGATVASAFGGGHMLNLSAITATLMAGPDCHPNPAKRWISTVTAGVGYLVFAGITGVIAALVAVAPPSLITAAAGLALFGALLTAMAAALEVERLRLPAVVTMVVTISGVSIVGIGSALWGLLAGLALMATTATWRKPGSTIAG